jgi:hypothetical protein
VGVWQNGQVFGAAAVVVVVVCIPVARVGTGVGMTSFPRYGPGLCGIVLCQGAVGVNVGVWVVCPLTRRGAA